MLPPTSATSSAEPHLFTLTGNLLAERTLEFSAWKPGKTQRAERESFQVGGKGINVAKMLNRLGAPSTALCFSGGAPGAECEAWLRERGFKFHAFAMQTPTRSGTVVRGGALKETTFLGPDAAPDATAVRACVKFLDAQKDGQVLALCGSFPGWSNGSFDPLRSALERWMRRGTLAADTYGPPLAWLMRRPLALVKINAEEFRALASDLEHLPTSSTVARWIVTDGAAALQIRDRDGKVRRLTPPKVREISPTGSGDVLFACVLHAFFRRRRSLREAVSFALPYAAANAAHPGVAEFPHPFRRV